MQVRQFFSMVRGLDETLEEWQARVDVAEFKALHKSLHEQGVTI
jgi:hypothetical protein